jgi:YidC/Oxa1 family membrane protein insertase
MQQQHKNLLLFIVLSFLIFVSWTALQNTLSPPKPKTPKKFEELKAQPWENTTPAALAGQIGGMAQLAGFADPTPIAVQAALGDLAASNRELWALKEKEAPKPEPVVVAGPEVAPKDIILGDDTRHNLRVTLTTLGGGVREIVLPKFQEADRLGLPVWQDGEGKRVPEPLHLVPNGDEDVSYLFFHYPSGKATNPVNTLGKVTWEASKLITDEATGEQRVEMWRTIPAPFNVKITKIYSLNPDDYHLGLEIKIEALGDRVQEFRYQLAGAHGLPIEGEWYTYTFRNSLIGVIDSRGNVSRDLQDSRAVGIGAGGKPVFNGNDPGSYIGYAGVVNQYFASMIAVDNHQNEGVGNNFLEWARPTREGTPNPLKPFLDDMTTRVNSVKLDLRPDKPIVHKYVLYNGPVKVRLLGSLRGNQEVSADPAVTNALVDRYENALHLDTLTDYHSPTAFGSFANLIGWTRLLIWSTNFMHGLLGLMHSIFINYGICIVLLTVLVRGAMFPLSRKQALASAKMQEKMAEMAPEVKKLEEKHKDDPMALQQAKNELYMRRGINPLAMMGSCWMVLLQMPIFLGLYYALQESIHFRLAPFLWIRNLAAPDMLIEWGENIPWISRPDDQGSMFFLGPFFNILPIIAVALMIVQQKMLTPPPTDEQQAMQQKMMKWMMVLFGFMFYKVAAGLCIYFIASSLWGLAERKLLPKKKPAGAPAATTDTAITTAPRGIRTGPGRPGATGRGGRNDRNEEEDSDGFMRKIKDWWEEVLKQASKK